MNAKKLLVVLAVCLALAGVGYATVQHRCAIWRNKCIQHLHWIAEVKRFLADEQGLKSGDTVSDRSVAEHIMDDGSERGLGGYGPACPAGGEYSVNPIGTNPTCSIPGHRLAP